LKKPIERDGVSNADEIAKDLSSFQPEKAFLEARRIILNGMNELLSGNETFAFETTLSSKTIKIKLLKQINAVIYRFSKYFVHN